MQEIDDFLGEGNHDELQEGVQNMGIDNHIGRHRGADAGEQELIQAQGNDQQEVAAQADGNFIQANPVQAGGQPNLVNPGLPNLIQVNLAQAGQRKDYYHKSFRSTRAGKSSKLKQCQSNKQKPQSNKEKKIKNFMLALARGCGNHKNTKIIVKKNCAFVEVVSPKYQSYRGKRSGRSVKNYEKAKAMSEFLWSFVENCPKR